MKANKNLQAVKLRAIARGLGANLTTCPKHGRQLMSWGDFITAWVRFGLWQEEGRIIFSAYHPEISYQSPRITVSATRPTSAIVRDVQNRFAADAEAFCLKARTHQRQREAREIEEKLRIQSFLDELGTNYATALQNAKHAREDFHSHGVSFNAHDVSKDRKSCQVTINCSEYCLRQIFRLLRADHKFRKLF